MAAERSAKFDLTGLSGIVTGGAGGLGIAISDLLLDFGASVTIADVSTDMLARASARYGDRAHLVAGDISREEDVVRITSETIARSGKIDIVINNAGILEQPGSSIRQNASHWRRIIDVNLQGTFLMSQIAARKMVEQRSGSIVNIASVAGLVGFPASNAYGVSKAAIAMLTKTMACDLARAHVRVNAVAPGPIETPMAEALGEEFALDRSALIRRIPLGRIASAAEIAMVVAFLCSDAASYITGAVIPVDGGWSAFGGIGDAARG